jgi:hypothetical protein
LFVLVRHALGVAEDRAGRLYGVDLFRFVVRGGRLSA